MADQNLRERYERRKSALKIERSSFDPHYKELAQFIAPRRGRFFVQDRNRGGDRYNSIINSKATVALRVARSGMLAGSMSPSSPWMSLSLEDPDLTHFMPAKVWLDRVEQLMYRIYATSNLYSQAPAMLGEMLLFGTGAMSHVDDFDDVARFYTHTVGSYLLGQDARQEVNTFIREWDWTALQIVEEYGYANASLAVRTACDRGNYDLWFPVTHIVEPNVEFSPTKQLSQFKRFRSATYEPGCLDKDQMLRDKGFDEFPFYTPRWDTTGEDVYGTDCPAMTALGDIKGLQIEERRKAQAIDKMVNPPLTGGAGVRNVPIDSLPGGLTVYEGDDKNQLRPLYSVNPQLGELRLDMKAVEERIDSAFYVHLFRAISDMAGIQPKNELELRQRDQERLLELGPVLEHLHGEFLAKLVDRTIKQCAKAGILPPPPPEIQGKQIKVTFISALARAQRSAAAASIERFTTFVAGLVSTGFKDAAFKLNVFDTIDEYAEVTGTTPRILVSNEQAEAQQQAIAQQQAAEQRAAAMNQAADTAQKGAGAAAALGGTPGSGGQSVLQNVQQAVAQRAQPNAFGPR